MEQNADLSDIKIIFACGECTFATTDRSELDSHLVTVHERSEIFKYDNEQSSTQPSTLEYVSPAPLLLAPINSQVSLGPDKNQACRCPTLYLYRSRLAMYLNST